MKGLLKRDCYIFSRPGKLIALLGTIFLLYYGGVVYPLRLYCDYVPNIKHDSLFGDRDIALRGARVSLLFYSAVILLVSIIFIAYFSQIIIKKDEAANWNMYLAITPVKRRTYVNEKYIVIVFVILFLSIPLSVSSVIYNHIGSKYDTGFSLVSFDVAKKFILSVSCWGAALSVLISTVLPASFYGDKKTSGRRFLVLILVAFIWATIISGFFSFLLKNYKFITSLDPLVNALVVFAFSCGVLFLSWFISQKVYKKREF